jgi:ATP sulfurylase
MGGREIRRLTELGVSLFRVNLSHTSVSALPGIISAIREHTSVPICLDTEGAQIRTGRLPYGSITLRDQALLRLDDEPTPADGSALSLYPSGIVRTLLPGTLVSIDFSSVLVQVVAQAPGHVTVRVLTGGRIGQNKAVTVLDQDIALPPLTRKDVVALRLGKELGIRHVALSFANRGPDVDEMRAACAPGTFVISKIECRGGLENLDEIAARSDALLIDRGDLSRELPIERIPILQKAIIGVGKAAGKRVYVATNLLESMVDQPTPTRAEVNDIYNTLLDGADGLVLAAETAIGKYPVGCAEMVTRLVREFEYGQQHPSPLPTTVHSTLVEPHGGCLVHRSTPGADTGSLAFDTALTVNDTVLLDCEQIAHGGYSPLTGFMGSESLHSVLAHNRLPSGLVWPMPIVLQVRVEQAAVIRPGHRIALLDADGMVHSLVDVTELHPVDLERMSSLWFGTTSSNQPGVARLAGGGSHFVAGDITLVRPCHSAGRGLELLPEQSRAIFVNKGWSKVVGFHTRDVAFRIDEHIQLSALEEADADGVFISPITGPGRWKGDGWSMHAITRSYQRAIDCGFYPRGRVLLGAIPSYRRWCGPREAAFAALREKNRGCTHFVVGSGGRELAESGTLREQRDYFYSLGDCGITPIFVDPLGWNAQTRTFRRWTEGDLASRATANQMRDQLGTSVPLPDWLVRPEVQDMLREDMSAGRPVFAIDRHPAVVVGEVARATGTGGGSCYCGGNSPGSTSLVRRCRQPPAGV